MRQSELFQRRAFSARNHLVVGLCLLISLIGATALIKSHTRAQSKPQVQIADHVLYRHLFHHVLALKKKADEAEKKGEDAAQQRTHFKRGANLTDAEAATLEQAALQYDEGEKILDARAKPIIDAYKAQFVNGQVPGGQKPEPPPAELRTLSQERDALALRGRDQLRSSFGSDFGRFDSFVKTRILADTNLQSQQ